MAGGNPTRPDHDPRKCYACGGKFSGRGWRYRGTKMTICESCHQFTRRPEDRDPVDTSDLVWRSEADKLIRNRDPLSR
jgi:ribosome-binding protein aMBF1 (putative translation factor)